VVCGEQLIHSPYMQCLASLAVGLHLDRLLCRPPVPPHLRHCPLESGTAVWSASEWAWLDCFSTTVKAAEALARGATFPESFCVPDLEPVPKDEMALLMVRKAVTAAVCDVTTAITAQSNRLCVSRTTVSGRLVWTSRSCPGPPPDRRYVTQIRRSPVCSLQVRVLTFICVRRTGTWGASVTCSCGGRGGTASWRRPAETSWFRQQPRPFLRLSRYARPRHSTIFKCDCSPRVSTVCPLVSCRRFPPDPLLPAGGVRSELHLCDPAQRDGVGLRRGQLRPSGAGKLRRPARPHHHLSSAR